MVTATAAVADMGRDMDPAVRARARELLDTIMMSLVFSDRPAYWDAGTSAVAALRALVADGALGPDVEAPG